MNTSSKLPASIPEHGLLVGWQGADASHWPPSGFSFGFMPKQRVTGRPDWTPVLYHGDGHLMTIAPTGSGKGVGAIIPALLRHRGPVIVIDPKGENHAVTARRRHELGHEVVLLDPFGVTGEPGASFNPLDLLRGPEAENEADVQMLAGLIVPTTDSQRDPYWDNRARFLVSALMLHLDATCDSGATLKALRSALHGDNAAMAALADGMLRSGSSMVRNGAHALTMGSSKTLASILSTAQSHVADLVGPRVEGATMDSSFDLQAVVDGRPLSIYIVIPPQHMESARRLLRLWIGALFALILRRRRRISPSTLFLLDEAAQLGPLDQLRQAITLLRGYGLQTWSFWQDLSQLQSTYPQDWETLYNNCHVHQVFGITTMHLATSIEAVNEVHTAGELIDMGPEELQLAIAGALPLMARRPDYLSDPVFAGQFDPNPFHA